MSHRTAIAVLCYVLVGFILRATHGTFHSTLVWALGGTIGIMGYLLWPRRREFALSTGTSSEFVFAAVAAASGWMLYFDPLLITAIPSRASSLVGGLSMSVAFAATVLAAMYYNGHTPPKPMAIVTIAAAWILLINLRVAALLATPNPQIDVFVTNTMACDYFLAGQNPYAAWYPDIYEGAKGYAPKFFYWPAYLYFATPFRHFAGDIRLATVAADLGTALCLALAGRRLGLSSATAWIAPLVWLANPVSLMVLELSWIDPVLIFGTAGMGAALVYRRFVLIGILAGIVAATKQYGLLPGLFALAAIWRCDRTAAARMAVAATTTFLAILAPWAISDWQSFYGSTIATYLQVAMRLDALSLVVWLKRILDVDVPGGFLLLGYAALVAACLWRLARTPREPGRRLAGLENTVSWHDWSAATALAFGGIFLFGKLAFCNYYHLVAFFIAQYAVLSLADDRRRITLLTAKPKAASIPSPVATGVAAWSN